MSKLVKDLITNDLKNRLAGVQDALLVNVLGLKSNAAMKLRSELRAKQVQLLVVKTSLARRATEGTPLAAAFDNVEGSVAIIWGGTDIVALAKEVVRLAGDKQYAPFAARGGVLDGARLGADEVEQVSKWPTREEQLSLLVGQILGPGSRLASQLCGPGAALVSQIKSRGEESESAPDEANPVEAAPAEAAG